jgi:hypothetical protein
MAFYKMVQNRAERIEAARNHGALEYKPSRNPMRAEKTPRPKDYRCFDFSIPTGRKDLKEWERWEYPEIDMGLMGKFKSQQHTYESFISQHNDYKRKLAEKQIEDKAKELEEEQRKGDATQRAALEASKAARSVLPPKGLWGSDQQQGSSTTASLSSLLGDEYNMLFGTDTKKMTKKGTQGKRVPRLPLGSDDNPDSPTRLKISEYRMISGLTPEAVAKWRAKRAAEFVTKQKHPLDPPTARLLVDKPFVVTFPRGGVEPKEPVSIKKIPPPANKYATEAVINTARLQDGLKSLMGELARTEMQLEREELKLALKNKTRTF